MKTLISIFFLFQFLLTYGQENETYTPRILILSPSEFKFDPKFKLFFDTLKLNSGIANEDVSNHPINIQQTIKSVQNYEKNSGYKGIVPLTIAQRMLFTMFRGERNFVVLMDTVTLKNINANNLAKLAKDYNVQHIVYFPLNEVFYKDDIGYGRIKLSVYDATLNKTTLDLEEIDNWIVNEEYDNPEKSSLQNPIGLLFNTSYFTWFRILETIYQNNPDYKLKIKGFDNDESDEIYTYFEVNKLLKTEFKKQYSSITFSSKIPNEIKNEIDNKKYLVNSNSIYDFYYNSHKDKCFGYFIDSVEHKNYLNPDFQINDIEKKLTEFKIVDFTNSKPKYFGYMIRGFKIDNRWYFDKIKLLNFKNSNLIECKKILSLYSNYFRDIDIFEDKIEPLNFDNDSRLTQLLFNRYDKFDWDIADTIYSNVFFWSSEYNDNYKFQEKIKSNNYILERDFKIDSLFNYLIIPSLKKINTVLIDFSKENLIISKDLQYFIYEIKNSSSQSSYVFFDLNENQLYNWNHPIHKNTFISNCYNELSIMRNDKYNLIIEDDFWNNNVFIKQNDKYLYLDLIH
jgi:hypothetical protein